MWDCKFNNYQCKLPGLNSLNKWYRPILLKFALMSEWLGLEWVGDESRVLGSDPGERDECTEESDSAGTWKHHHILGVALTQADVTQWKPQGQPDTGLLCLRPKHMRAVLRAVGYVENGNLKSKKRFTAYPCYGNDVSQASNVRTTVFNLPVERHSELDTRWVSGDE